MPRNTNINFRKGTSTEWSTINPTLDIGEPGYDTTNKKLKIGDGSTNWNSLAFIGEGASVSVDNSICGGRLTLNSGNPEGINGSGTIVYFTPYKSNRIALYDGSSWGLYSFSELSITATGSNSNTNWDVFIFNNSGTLTLEKVQWTNDSTRATALALQDGVYVRSGSPTKRYIGTFRTDETLGPVTQTTSTESRRFVWNAYNKIYKNLYGSILNLTHTYGNTTVYRAWNNNTTVGQGRYLFILGLPDNIAAGFWVNHLDSAVTALGLDATNSGPMSPLLTAVNTDTSFGFRAAHFTITNQISAGYHFLQLQQLGSSVPATFSNVEQWGQILC